ncbi:MAG: hypothetical protein ACRDB7_01335 [Fusobacteriaceae bacterium]
MFDATSFAHQHLSIICHPSHLFTSQALSGWMGADAHFQVSPEIFDFLHIKTAVAEKRFGNTDLIIQTIFF